MSVQPTGKPETGKVTPQQAEQSANEFKASLQRDNGKGFAASAGASFAGDSPTPQEAVKQFETFMDTNAAALPIGTILDIAEMLIGIIVKDPNLQASIKAIIAVIRRFFPTNAVKTA